MGGDRQLRSEDHSSIKSNCWPLKWDRNSLNFIVAVSVQTPSRAVLFNDVKGQYHIPQKNHYLGPFWSCSPFFLAPYQSFSILTVNQ